jgi:hypothetical protein
LSCGDITPNRVLLIGVATPDAGSFQKHSYFASVLVASLGDSLATLGSEAPARAFGTLFEISEIFGTISSRLRSVPGSLLPTGPCMVKTTITMRSLQPWPNCVQAHS